MIKYEDIFNKYTLNIFTDASMGKVNNETIGVPGYVAVIDNEIIPWKIKRKSEVLRNTTNNECELYAIHLAVQEAIVMKDKFQIINIFSDSQFSVYGLREWIFKWINNIQDDVLYNSSGKAVANQGLFMAIIYNIINYDLQINIYHNRGHFSLSQLNEFKRLFTKHNFLNDFIDNKLAMEIIKYNDDVDNFTRDRIKLLNQKTLVAFPELLLPEYVARDDIDLNYYKELLNV